MKKLNRKGSAIAFALLIAIILLISEFYLMNQNSNNLIIRKKNINNLQSYFAAKSAIQHAMLKCQIMPTQLYDAASFAAARNPYFDFGEYAEKPASVFKNKYFSGENVYIKLANNINPGPRFLTKSIKGDYNNLSSWSEVSKVPDNACDYLKKYKEDITFNSKESKTFVYPYTFSYDVVDLSVLALQGHRKYNEEAVKITVVGRWQDDSLGEQKETTLTTIVRIKRNE